jgi:glucose-1-phosphate adenylyltransferase
MIQNVLAYVLAGGEGSRLYPLTQKRAKSAVPFGGTRRLIDIVLSNLVNSNIKKICVLTQQETQSLHRHMKYGWYPNFSVRGEFLEILPTRKTASSGWSRGTAEAVRHNAHFITNNDPKVVDVFGGDHVYIMDISKMNDFHLGKNADLTISVIPVKRSLAARTYGVLEVDNDWRIKGFEEKPENPKPMPGNKDLCLVSMGNYAFNPKSLTEYLELDAQKEFSSDPEAIRSNPEQFSKHDFGFDVIPTMLKDEKMVFAYNFMENSVPGQKKNEIGYWRDVGNIDEFYKANMELRSANPPINLDIKDWEILTYISSSRPVKTEGKGSFLESIASNGSVIRGTAVGSILSYNTTINEEAEVTDSILMGDNVIGKGAIIKNAIIDKRVIVPDKETVGIDKEKDEKRGFYKSSSKTIPVVPEDYKFD